MPLNSPVPGPGSNDDRHIATALIHRGHMLKRKAAVFARQGAGHNLYGNIPGSTFLGITCREHFSLGGCLQIPMDLFVY